MTEGKPKRVQIGTTVDAETAAALSDIRWARKVDKFSDIIREALADYIAKHAKVNGEANGK